MPISGVVLADQVKSLDWTVRNAEVVGRAPHSVVSQVLERLSMLLDPECS
jgi:mRNA interferase MazF